MVDPPRKSGSKSTASRPATPRRTSKTEVKVVQSPISKWLAPSVAILAAAVVFLAFVVAVNWPSGTRVEYINTAGSQQKVDPSPSQVGNSVSDVSPSPAEQSPAPADNGNGQLVGDTGTMPQPVSTWNVGSWQVQQMKDLTKNPIVLTWIKRLQDPEPANWRTYPNIPNPDVSSFSVRNGAEYGVANVPFCEQDMRCDFVVPGWSYRLITARYNFQGMNCNQGCLLLLINVMDKTVTWRNQMADNGFTVAGRYWNGDKLDQAVWGLVSNTAANMLNMPTLARPGEILNSGNPANAGGNCGDVKGCNVVNATVVVSAGTDILAVLKTTVTR